jgi:hypothetical protein
VQRRAPTCGHGWTKEQARAHRKIHGAVAMAEQRRSWAPSWRESELDARCREEASAGLGIERQGDGARAASTGEQQGRGQANREGAQAPWKQAERASRAEGRGGGMEREKRLPWERRSVQRKEKERVGEMRSEKTDCKGAGHRDTRREEQGGSTRRSCAVSRAKSEPGRGTPRGSWERALSARRGRRAGRGPSEELSARVHGRDQGEGH